VQCVLLGTSCAMGSAVLGWSCAIVAAFTFSVQYVPVKSHEVYDGITFQWFLTGGALFTGFLITLATGDLFIGFDYLPLIAGAMWGLSNYLCVPLIKLIGMGLGFSLYHFVNIMCGYCIGRFGLFGIPQSGSLISDTGCVLVFFSFIVLTLVEAGHEETLQGPPLLETIAPGIDEEYRRQYQKWRLGEARGSRDGKANFYFGAFSVLEQVPDLQGAPDTDKAPRLAASDMLPRSNSDPGPLTARLLNSEPQKSTLMKIGIKLLGALLAIVCGVLTGTCGAPATLYNLRHPGRPTAAVFPMCLGSWIMSTVIYLVYASYARIQRLPVRHTIIEPSFIAGALWSIGNACILLAVTQIPFTLAYSTGIIGCLILAGIYSLVIFREITQPKQVAMFWSGIACQSVGVVLIACGGGGG